MLGLRRGETPQLLNAADGIIISVPTPKYGTVQKKYEADPVDGTSSHTVIGWNVEEGRLQG